MKKVIYIICSLALTFTACDPMEDVYDELDKVKKDNTVAATELTEDDYALLEDSTDYPHVAADHYFSNEAEAAKLIPAVLNNNYAHLTNGATVTVAYNTAKIEGVSNEVSEWESYTISDADYAAIGRGDYGDLNKTSQVYDFLDYKYPTPADRQLVVLTYDLYTSGKTETITDSYYFINGDWSNIYHVTKEDFASVKNTYNSFSGSDEENMPVFFDKFLKNDVIVAKEGDFRYVSYYYYDSKGDKSRSQRVMAMYFDGTNWVAAVGAVQKATLKFQKKNNVWVPDLSILYTLTSEDYDWVGKDENNIGSSTGRDNLRMHGNFSTYNWTTEELYQAMGAILKLRFPNAEVGQKFKVTFDTYPGGDVEYILIKRENGEFTKAEDGE